MANNRLQKLTSVLIGKSNPSVTDTLKRTITYNIRPSSEVIYSSNSKEERDAKLTQLRQEKMLAYQWAKSGYETSMEQLAGATQVKVMYRDADLMDAWPECGAALDIVAEEATTINKKGKILNIYSPSERIKSVLEDLFVNRLDINIWANTIVRATAKYGNEFMFLNIDPKNGVIGWRELPVHEMTRVENGIIGAYGGITTYTVGVVGNKNPDDVQFVWEGHNQQIPYRNWQVAHFRLINNSLYLPYGVSWLNKARRHWRILSMMEDGMLLYRLERSIERRIFKVNVGMLDNADVPAFLQDFMNNVKRAPIIDPQTGQVDLRKNFLDVSADYVIPVRPGQDPSSIETLNSAQNATSMDDIKYVENKVLCALKIPKTFLNFQEPQGKGQNLSLMDLRFCRTINTIQQAVLMELNKIAIIHLYLLGFEDDLDNFTLSFNSPSNQIELMEIDNMTKRVQLASAALAEQGCGIPLMSWHQVQKEILGKTDQEISTILDEIRLESALAIELQRTPEIIRQTHLFDRVDRLFGEPGAKYSKQLPGQEGGLGGGPGGAPPMMGGGFGDDLGDLGEPGSDMEGEIGGDEGMTDLESMEGNEGGESTPLMEAIKAISNEDNFYVSYLRKIVSESNEPPRRPSIIDKNFFINEELNSIIKNLDVLAEEEKKKDDSDITKEIITE